MTQLAEPFSPGDSTAPVPEAQVYLHPGQLFFTSEPTIVTTILGPCVSVCIFDDESGAAGINHFLVPMKLGTSSPRSADIANEMLLARFLENGIPVRELKAKVFGGAMMRSVKSDLAERNVHSAFEFLTKAGVRVVGSNVGGERGRKLHFRTTDGQSWIRFL